jgi:uncharacterized protein (TIGR02265 family)
MSTGQRVVFGSLYEGFVQGLGPRLTAEVRAQMKAEGLDFDKLPPALPAADSIRYTRRLAILAFPDEPEVEALRLLGLHAIRGWQQTILGSAAAAMLRLIGPHRTLKRLSRAFQTTNNYSQATSEVVSDKEALVIVNDVDTMPSYWQGIFEAGLELLRLEGTVQLERLDGPQGTFRLKWK